MLLKEIISRIRYSRSADRIGPDIPYTHWMLHYRSTMQKLCNRKFVHFGEGSEFRPGAYAIACSGISIGSNVVIRPNTMLFACNDSTITIEDNVLIGSGVHIYVHNHRFNQTDIPISIQGHYPSADVIVKEGAWLGANSVVLPGVIIGENSVVGAGSIVTRSVPDCVVVAGNPAKVIKKI